MIIGIFCRSDVTRGPLTGIVLFGDSFPILLFFFFPGVFLGFIAAVRYCRISIMCFSALALLS